MLIFYRYLYGNELSGKIPTTIGLMKELVWLYVFLLPIECSLRLSFYYFYYLRR